MTVVCFETQQQTTGLAIAAMYRSDCLLSFRPLVVYINNLRSTDVITSPICFRQPCLMLSYRFAILGGVFGETFIAQQMVFALRNVPTSIKLNVFTPVCVWWANKVTVPYFSLYKSPSRKLIHFINRQVLTVVNLLTT